MPPPPSRRVVKGWVDALSRLSWVGQLLGCGLDRLRPNPSHRPHLGEGGRITPIRADGRQSFPSPWSLSIASQLHGSTPHTSPTMSPESCSFNKQGINEGSTSGVLKTVEEGQLYSRSRSPPLKRTRLPATPLPAVTEGGVILKGSTYTQLYAAYICCASTTHTCARIRLFCTCICVVFMQTRIRVLGETRQKQCLCYVCAHCLQTGHHGGGVYRQTMLPNCCLEGGPSVPFLDMGT